MFTIANTRIEVTINPDRGAEITSIVPAHNPQNVLASYAWTSPIPADGFTNYGDSEQNWLSGYRGGWQETVPNAGQESHLDGMPLPFHGEASVIPWTVVEQNEASCTLRAHLRPTLSIDRRMRLLEDRAGLEITTTVTNTGVQDVPFIWGHHPAFAYTDDTVLHLPEGRYEVEPSQRDDIATSSGVWPRARDDSGTEIDLSRIGAEAGSRLIYRHGHSEGWAVLRQSNSSSHVAMSWDVDAYPAVWVWQNRSHPGFPWFGRMQCLAVEPQRAWPMDGLAGARERGQDIVVSPGEERSSWLVMAFPQSLPPTVSGVTRIGDVV